MSVYSYSKYFLSKMLSQVKDFIFIIFYSQICTKTSCNLLGCYVVAIFMFGTNNLEHSCRNIDSPLSNIGVFY